MCSKPFEPTLRVIFTRKLPKTRFEARFLREILAHPTRHAAQMIPLAVAVDLAQETSQQRK
jgi:hypothetical protein